MFKTKIGGAKLASPIFICTSPTYDCPIRPIRRLSAVLTGFISSVPLLKNAVIFLETPVEEAENLMRARGWGLTSPYACLPVGRGGVPISSFFSGMAIRTALNFI